MNICSESITTKEKDESVIIDQKYSVNVGLVRAAQSDDIEKSEQATDELVRLNMGLVRSVAVRFRDRGTEYEDLIQIGLLGMLKAIRSFDCERGTQFSTYAVVLISGEIRRHFRDDGIIKVSRYHKKLGAELANAKAKIASEQGREPKIEEIAALCGVSVEEAAIAIDAMAPVCSLTESPGDDDEGLSPIDKVSDGENEMEKLCDKIALSQAISKMPQQWQKIVLFRYFRNMTQQQTACTLGLSQVKVSREEKKILEFLRQEMT